MFEVLYYTMGGTLADLSAVFSRWRTWFLMANQDINMRYRRSLLGPFWISLSMAVLVLGMAGLYSGIMRQDYRDYLLWLGCSFLVWFLISGMVTDGMQIAIEAESQLRSVRIPLPVLAARMVHRNVVIFLHNAVVIAGLMALFELRPSVTMWAALPGVAVIIGVGFFVALVLGPLCLRFRDVAQVVANVMQISFFLTPIIWKPDQGRVPEWVIEANPFYHLIQLFRAPLLGEWPTHLDWVVSLGILGGLAVAALLTLALSRRKIFIWL